MPFQLSRAPFTFTPPRAALGEAVWAKRPRTLFEFGAFRLFKGNLLPGLFHISKLPAHVTAFEAQLRFAPGAMLLRSMRDFPEFAEVLLAWPSDAHCCARCKSLGLGAFFSGLSGCGPGRDLSQTRPPSRHSHWSLFFLVVEDWTGTALLYLSSRDLLLPVVQVAGGLVLASAR